MRNVICHYHIFKNGGTSFNRILRRSFGDDHHKFDGPFRFSKTNQDELLKIIRNFACQSIVSHQINLPVPTDLEIRVIPAVFIRHPIFRLRSIYNFSRKVPETSAASSVRNVGSFREWVGAALHDPDMITMVSNAQSRLVSGVYGRQGVCDITADGRQVVDVQQGIRNLEVVKLLGRTEFFGEDVCRFNDYLADDGIELDLDAEMAVARNTTASDLELPFESRLSNLITELGSELYETLLHRNDQDMMLFDYANRRLGTPAAKSAPRVATALRFWKSAAT